MTIFKFAIYQVYPNGGCCHISNHRTEEAALKACHKLNTKYAKRFKKFTTDFTHQPKYESRPI